MAATSSRVTAMPIDARAIIVEQLRHERRGRRVAAVVTALFALVAAHAPLWSGLARRYYPAEWSPIFLVTVGVVMALFLVATTALIFGAPLVRRSALAAVLAFDLASILIFFVVTSSPEKFAEMPSFGWACFKGGAIHAVAMTAFLFIVKDYIRRSPSALILAGVMTAGTAIVALHYHCANQGFWHLVVQHGAVLAPGIALLLLFFSPKKPRNGESGPF